MTRPRLVQSGERGVRWHTCSGCGRSGPWTDDWEWFGSLRQMDRGEALVKACSAVCKYDLKQAGHVA